MIDRVASDDQGEERVITIARIICCSFRRSFGIEANGLSPTVDLLLSRDLLVAAGLEVETRS